MTNTFFAFETALDRMAVGFFLAAARRRRRSGRHRDLNSGSVCGGRDQQIPTRPRRHDCDLAAWLKYPKPPALDRRRLLHVLIPTRRAPRSDAPEAEHPASGRISQT